MSDNELIKQLMGERWLKSRSGCGIFLSYPQLTFIDDSYKQMCKNLAAAIADIPHTCPTCKHNRKDGCALLDECVKENCWEWRGIEK